jgi:hypothetical protein
MLPPATALRVRVPELRETGGLATVTLTDATGRPFRSLAWNAQPQREWRMQGGEIELRSLPPGAWSVSIAASGGETWSGQQITAPGAAAELTLE